jgi:hypothetical protein
MAPGNPKTCVGRLERRKARIQEEDPDRTGYQLYLSGLPVEATVSTVVEAVGGVLAATGKGLAQDVCTAKLFPKRRSGSVIGFSALVSFRTQTGMNATRKRLVEGEGRLTVRDKGCSVECELSRAAQGQLEKRLLTGLLDQREHVDIPKALRASVMKVFTAATSSRVAE